MTSGRRRRLLMVCYYFPPLGGIGSLRALKFAQYLPEFGWDVTVLAPRNGAYYRDASLEYPEERVIRTFSLEISRLTKQVFVPGTGDTAPARVGPLGRRLRDWARRFVYRPDGQIGWLPPAIVAGRSHLRDRHVDAIFSTSFPVTAHLIARQLHRESGIPWVAEFRDPFADALPEGDPRRAWAEKVERGILHDASATVVPSVAWADRTRARGAASVTVITNGCDPIDFPASRRPDSFVLTHLGSFMPERQDAGAVLTSLADLRREGLLQNAKLRLVGEPQAAVLAAIRSMGLAGAVDVTGFLPYKEALAQASASSALLVAGAQDATPILKGWIPAKVFDYLATGLPIVYVGDLQTDVARLLSEQPGCWLVAPHDRHGARRALLESASSPPVSRNLTGFTRRDLTRALAGVLDAAEAVRDR